MRRLAAQAGLVIAGLPVRAELPLILWLACSKGFVNFDLVKAAASRHGVLIRQHMASGAQSARVATQAQGTRDGEPAPVCG